MSHKLIGQYIKFFSFISAIFIHQSQTIAEVNVPELQFLATHLKPEECIKIVANNLHIPLTKPPINNLTKEEDCFEKLVKWICRIRTITKDTYPILKDRLKDIGRKDLLACLVDYNKKTSASPKMIREVPPSDDSDDYDGVTTVSESSTIIQKSDLKRNEQNDIKVAPSSNRTIEKIDGQTFIRLTVKTAGIILISSILLTCFCTLCIRSKLAKLFNKLRGKRKRSKFMPIDADDDRMATRNFSMRKTQKKRKRAPSYDMVHTGTQNSVPVTPREPEEPPPTGCYKCYKKKRKKSAKKPKR